MGIHEANPSKTWKNACRHGSSRSSSGIVRHRPGETSIQLCTDMEPSTRGAQSNSEGDTYAACVPQGPTEVSAALWQLTAPRLPIGSLRAPCSPKAAKDAGFPLRSGSIHSQSRRCSWPLAAANHPTGCPSWISSRASRLAPPPRTHPPLPRPLLKVRNPSWFSLRATKPASPTRTHPHERGLGAACSVEAEALVPCKPWFLGESRTKGVVHAETKVA